MTKPEVLPPDPKRIPEELRALPQWLVWRLEKQKDKNGKINWTKVPYVPGTSHKASSIEPDDWVAFDVAYDAYVRRLRGVDGIGFVFTVSDPYCGIDIDAKNAPLPADAQDIVELVDSYTELSPGGRGLHIIARGKIPGDRGRRTGPYEMYDHARFFSMTGEVIGGRAGIHGRQAAIESVNARLFGRPTPKPKTDKPRASGSSRLDDEQVVARISRSATAAKFGRLMAGDITGYPSQSEADSALCCILAWWTNGDAGQVDRIFRTSGLVRQGKWVDRQDYREQTIARAIELAGPGYMSTAATPHAKKSSEATEASGVAGALTLDQNSEATFAIYMLGELAGAGTPVISADGRLYRYDPALGIWSELPSEQICGQLQYRLNGALVQRADGSYSRLAMNDNRVKGTYRSMLRYPEINKPDFFSMPAPGIAFANGFVSVSAEGIRFSPHSPDNRARQRLPSNYEPEAESKSWNEMLNAVFDNDPDAQDKKKVLQEFAGACMCGLATEYDRCLVFVGPGGNGKTTTQQALEENIFITGTVSHISPQKWKQEYAVSQLCGKLVNIVSELPNERLTDNEIFKGVITGDVISARDPYKLPYEFRPRAGHIFACNELPNTNDLTDGFWQRFVFLTFNRNFRSNPAGWESRESILTRIRAEAPGVALWALHGGVRLLKYGYTIPSSSGAIRDEWHEESCSVREWSNEFLEKTPEGEIPTKTVYDTYRQWAAENGRPPVASITMSKRLKKYGFKLSRNKRTRTVHAAWAPTSEPVTGPVTGAKDRMLWD